MFADDVSVAFNRAGQGFVCAMAPTGPERHPWMAIAPDRGNMHMVWVASTHQAMGYIRSLDGGATFDAAGTIPAPEGTGINGPIVAAGRDGLVAAIYAVGDVSQSDPDAAGCPGDPGDPGGLSEDLNMQIEVICSTEAGRSFAMPVTLGTSAFVIRLEGDVNPNSSPVIAAAPNQQALYAAFVTREADTDHSDVMLTASFDRGSSWSTPVAATPPDNRIYFQPQLAIDPFGRVALSAFALADDRIDTVLFTSPAAQLSFGPPLTITSRSFDPTLGGPGGKHGAWWVGDYQRLVADATGTVHVLWNDTRTRALELFAAVVR